jgi:hypothetical protein
MLSRSDLLPPDMEPSPEATYVWSAPNRKQADAEGRVKGYLTATNACHLALVEVDAETGQVRILRYYIVDDCGTRLNPATLDGMIQGAVAQGVGAALLEEYVYDDDCQPHTTTLGLPAAHHPRRADDADGRHRDALPLHPARREGRRRGRDPHHAGRDPVRDQRRARAARRAREVPATP